MLIDLLWIGLKDVFRYYKEFFLFLFSVIIVSILTCSAVLSTLDSNEYEKSSQSKFYQVAPLKNDLDDTEALYHALDEIYSNGGYSWFSAEYSQGTFIVCMIGHFEEMRIIWAVQDDFLKKYRPSDDQVINFTDVSEQVNELNFGSIDISDYTLIKPVDVKYQCLHSYDMDMTGLMGLIENTIFTDEGKNKSTDTRFEEIFRENGSLYVKKYIRTDAESDERFMIFSYVSVYILLLVVVLLLSFSFFFQFLLSELYREYRVNIVCGATKGSILIRNIVFALSTAVCNLLVVELLNAWKTDAVFFIAFIISASIFFLFTSITVLMLKKTDFIANLRENW